MSSLDPKKIKVRDLAEEDIPHVLDYWYRSPPEFVQSRAVDPAKLPTEADFEKGLREKCQANRDRKESKLNALVILYDGQAIGMHTVFPLEENDFGIFHAHIWKAEWRHRGVGMISYPLACQLFVERFGLKKIVFKTPLQNRGAIRVKEKLGSRSLGEETIGFAVIRDGTRAQVFEWTREEIYRHLQSQTAQDL